MIKVFPLRNLQYSPFIVDYGRNILEGYGIVVSDELNSDLIVSSSCRKLLLMALKYGTRKKYLVWADEPHLDTHFTKVLNYPFFPKIDVLNVYTGLYYTNNLWLPTNTILPFLSNFEFKHRKVAALMVYGHKLKRKSRRYKDKDISLDCLRTQIALEGHRMGVLDIYGRGWPEGIAKGESRDGDWRTSKLKLLSGYHFNLAFENTNWKYYCTEKIWDAIQAGCLPIYYGKGNAIYEDFPKESFLDYCQFGNAVDLFSYIQAMNPQEFMRRMNLCIEAFNTAVEKRKGTADPIVQQFDERLKHGMPVGFMKNLTEVTAKRILEMVGQ